MLASCKTSNESFVLLYLFHQFSPSSPSFSILLVRLLCHYCAACLPRFQLLCHFSHTCLLISFFLFSILGLCSLSSLPLSLSLSLSPRPFPLHFLCNSSSSSCISSFFLLLFSCFQLLLLVTVSLYCLQ